MKENIIDTLPSAWNQLKLKDYQKIVAAFKDDSVLNSATEFEGMFASADMTIRILSILTNQTIEELEALPMHAITKADSKLKFLNAVPKADKKSSMEWKKLEEVSYNDFVSFNQYQPDLIANLHYVMSGFSKIEMKPEDVLEMDMEAVFSGFFTLKTTLRTSTNGMLRQSLTRLLKLSIREKMETHFTLRKLKTGKLFNRTTAGTGLPRT